MEYYNRFRRFLYQGFIPVTKSIILICGVIFILFTTLRLFHLQTPIDYLVLTSENCLRFPWTFLTYPLVNPDPFVLIFALLWLWFAGGSLERSWGSWTYFIFIILGTLVTGILMVLAGISVIGGLALADIWLLLVGITWAWASIQPDQEVLFFGIIPIRLVWLAWINAAYIFFRYAYEYHWLVGLTAISSILVVYMFKGKGPWSKGIRYWAWCHGFSFKRWREERRRRIRKKKFRVLH